MGKTFFNEYEACDENGMELSGDVDVALKPIVDKWLASGYSCREIGGLMINAVVSLMAYVELRRAVDKRKSRGVKFVKQCHEELPTPAVYDDEEAINE